MRSPNPLTTMAESVTNVQRVTDLIRCICGCTTFTRAEIESLFYANMDSFMANPTSVRFFRNIADPDPESESQRALRCYELCAEIRCNVDAMSDEQREQLLELCPTYRWEQNFEEAIEEKKLDKFLQQLMEECKFLIEQSDDYSRYKQFLRDKCKRLPPITSRGHRMATSSSKKK